MTGNNIARLITVRALYTGMGDDELTLTAVYRFDWPERSRRTDDPDAFTEDPSPEAIEVLAELGRADPECEVTLIGMGA